MATLAERLKPTLRRVRAIPGKKGLRVHTVKLLSRGWSGTHSGDGGRFDVELTIVEGNNQPPKIRWVSDEELAVGALSSGTVEIGPITADDSSRTWLDDLQGAELSTGEARYLVITGPKCPNGVKHRITRITAHKAMHYMIQAQPVDNE